MYQVQKAVAFAFNVRLVLQILLEPIAPLWPVNGRHSQDHRGEFPLLRSLQQDLFGLDENFRGLRCWFRWTGLRDERTIGLSINAGAAGIDEFLRGRGQQPLDQVSRPLELNRSVVFSPAASRTDAVDDPVI